MSFSNFLETEILDHVFGGNAYSAPGTLYVGLFTAAPSDTGGGTEVSGGGYARQSAAFTVSGNEATNSASIEYPTATASYGTVTHVGIFDAASAGDMLCRVQFGSIVKEAADSLVINWDLTLTAS